MAVVAPGVDCCGREVRVAPNEKGAWFRGGGDCDAGAGDWGDDGDLHAGSRGAAEVAAGDQTGRALALRRQGHCCGWGGYTQDEEFSLFNYELYRRFRDNTPAFTDLAAFEGGGENLAVRRRDAKSRRKTRNGQFVSGNFFRTFGVGPWIGRVFSEADDMDSAASGAVMSYQAWVTKYGADPSVVGRAFQINGKPFTVVGVAAPGFFGADLRGWAICRTSGCPCRRSRVLEGETTRLKVPNSHWLDIIGRVKPGTDPKALESQLKTRASPVAGEPRLRI